jgi:YD repeat-containing protein
MLITWRGRAALIYPSNLDQDFGSDSTRYFYDGPDLVTLTNPVGEETTFEWDDLGRPTRMVQANGVASRRFYNDAGNLDSLDILTPDGTFYLRYSTAPLMDPGYSWLDRIIPSSTPCSHPILTPRTSAA